MATIIDKLEKAQIKRVPSFDAGDRLRVHFQVVEGTRRRTQVFEGVVIKRQGSGARETFTVRKQSFGVGVERTFPVHSTKIEKIEVAARGEVRRAKLYYLRDRVGKRARVRERAWTPTEQARLDAEMAGAYDEKGSQDEAELVQPEPEATESAESEAVTGDESAAQVPASEEPTAEEPVAAETAAEEPAAEEQAEETSSSDDAEPSAESDTEAKDETSAEADSDESAS
ncbi:MAG: 50S ribosomal protein L19 [Actinobacteria bacterium]|nr:50S ribosomal protein L19 [Actinomycetota bacterium]